MRAWMPVFVTFFLLLAVRAEAAPTCVNKNGDTIRCGTPGAMPVGWTPSPQILWERQLAQPQGPDAETILKVIIGIGLFLAMIALMPDFDGARAWDRQEGDDEETDD